MPERIANSQMSLQAQQFNASQDFQREQFNAANANAIESANVAFERQLTLAENAAQNAANRQNAQNSFNMTLQERAFANQEFRDSANYLRQSYENDQTRRTQLYAVALGNEAAAGNSSNTTIEGLMGLADGFLGG
jgi:1,4-alpha-glucan branching enzyme